MEEYMHEFWSTDNSFPIVALRFDNEFLYPIQTSGSVSFLILKDWMEPIGEGSVNKMMNITSDSKTWKGNIKCCISATIFNNVPKLKLLKFFFTSN